MNPSRRSGTRIMCRTIVNLTSILLLSILGAEAYCQDDKKPDDKKQEAKSDEKKSDEKKDDGKLEHTKLMPAKLIPNLCVVKYRVSTASPECQAFFDQGLGYFYSYVWME